MKVKILSVHNHGDHNEEHVLLDVLEDCDIGTHIITDSTYTSEGNISNKLRHIYWFPDKEVKKGDLVSLRTKSGENTELENNAGRTVHRFFWGLKAAVWNDDGDAAVLLEVKDWSHFKAKKS